MMASVPRCGGGIVLIVSALTRRRRISSSSCCGLPRLRSNNVGFGCRPFSSVHHTSTCCSLSDSDASASTSISISTSSSSSTPSDPVKEAAGLLDIRVGRILRAWRHPEADSLYVEEVDVGEDEPRTICSGLVNYIPLDHLQDIKVVVLANLKPRNMRGVKSNGMLMAASDASHETVELLVPAEGSVPGEKIWFGADEEKDKQPDPAAPNQVQKKKIWECIQPHLKTTDACAVVLGLQQYPMRTSAGVVACRSLKNANVS